MINIILNEKEYAKRLLNGDCHEQNPYLALSLISRYDNQVDGLRNKKIIKHLTEYLYANYAINDSDKVGWTERIESMAANASKHKLIEVNGVRITKNEMEYIAQIKGASMRRLAFTVLVLAKFGNLKNPHNNGWVTTPTKSVFEMACVSCSSKEREIKIGKLYDRGSLEFPKNNINLNYRVTYINDNSEEALFVDDFRNLGYQYMDYVEGGFTRCKECGIIMRAKPSEGKRGAVPLYCPDCRTYTPKVVKQVKCASCGDIFWVSSRNNNSKRCPMCAMQHRKEYYKKWKQEKRGADLSTAQI